MNKKPPVAAYRGQSLAVSDEETAGDAFIPGRNEVVAGALSAPMHQMLADLLVKRIQLPRNGRHYLPDARV
jgi:hypothetical protein